MSTELNSLRLVPPTTEDDLVRRRAKAAAKMRAWRAMHPDRVKAYNSTHYKRNQEHIKAKGAAYHAAHQEHRRAYSAAWHAAHPEYMKAYGSAYYAANKERLKIGFKAWRAANRERLLWEDRAKKYGITREAFALLLQVQNTRCAICAVPFTEVRRGAFVDHDHVTGCVRGLLCQHCNMGLGGFRDSPEHLIAAASYLKAHA